jgi:hypothetical protein
MQQRGLCQIVARMAFAAVLAAPACAFAQDPNTPATFNERYPAEQLQPPGPQPAAPAQQPATPPQPPAQQPAASPPQPAATQTPQPSSVEQSRAQAYPTPAAAKDRNITASTRVASKKRGRTHVVVEPRSFLDAGTEVAPGERKFLDYALPPTHTPMGVVQNTGGRVGWHNSPLPGPFFPWFD